MKIAFGLLVIVLCIACIAWSRYIKREMDRREAKRVRYTEELVDLFDDLWNVAGDVTSDDLRNLRCGLWMRNSAKNVEFLNYDTAAPIRCVMPDRSRRIVIAGLTERVWLILEEVYPGCPQILNYVNRIERGHVISQHVNEFDGGDAFLNQLRAILARTSSNSN